MSDFLLSFASIQVRRTADHDSLIFEVVVREGKGVADRGVGIDRNRRINPMQSKFVLEQ
jgi:hypothetical protein